MSACPRFNPTTCCEVLVERETQLIPPALANTVGFTKTLEASIEHVSPEKVTICGVIHKTLTYTAVLENGTLVPGFQILDDIPFQCFIDREDANEGDLFDVAGVAIVSEVSSQEQNFGFKAGFSVAFKFKEKEIVKVCIRKVVPLEIAIGVETALSQCNVSSPILGQVIVNNRTFAGIPVVLTVAGQATISPTTVFTRANGSFTSTITPFGPGNITITVTVTVNGVTQSTSSPPLVSPCA
jgi:hypothetical protein